MTSGHRRASGVLGLVVMAALVVGSCGVGERPTLVEADAVGGQPGTPTGNAAADDVLELLEGDLPGEVTANYSITTKFGGRRVPRASSARATGCRSPSATCASSTTAICRPAT